MKLTRKKAIELCIELWTWLAETGLPKEQWPRWEEFEDTLNYCWFCEYNNNQMVRYNSFAAEECKYCPYFQKFGNCEYYKSPYMNWYHANEDDDVEGCKKYAKLFLGQIQSLRSKK